MAFRFDDQDHQLTAVASFTDLLDNVLRNDGPAPELDQAALLSNLRTVQKRNGLEQDDGLELVTAETFDGETYSFPNFSTEMETGTGKTYAYIRTALTLAKRHGLRQFLIVVPSVAIREGTHAAFVATRPHFETHPDLSDVPYTWKTYRSDQPHLIDDFTRPSATVQFLITTLAAFNRKDDNRIYRGSETLQLFSEQATGSQMEKLQAVRPVLILDEPQNMESPLSKRALATLRPLLALRFSATHEDLYNLVYRLGPREARELGLVKRVAVRGVSAVLDPLGAPVRCIETTLRRGTAKARLSVVLAHNDGSLHEREITVEPTDDLGEVTGRSNYDGYVVDEIRQDGVVWDDDSLPPAIIGEDDSQSAESVWRDQIAHTLRVHFERQADLDERGLDVKVLSLFFIERVADYRDGRLPGIFEEEYRKLNAKYPSYTAADPSAVRGAYFSQTAKGKYQDEAKSDEDQLRAVDLILRKKEELLSKAEPVSFVFSHTALGEGWDNPNVFQICFLRHSRSEVQRRQQVGRGLRIPVTQQLERVFDKDVNRLTLIVNESFEEFVSKLNAQYVAAPGGGGGGGKSKGKNKDKGDPLPIDNDATKVRVEAKASKRASDEFMQLWGRIRYKTHYRVALDEKALVAGLAAVDWDALDAIGITRNVVSEAELEAIDSGAFVAGQGRALQGSASAVAVLPDLVALIEGALHDREPRLTLTRRTIAAALRAVPKQNHRTAVRAPEQWAAVVAAQIRDTTADIMVNRIRYELRPESEWWKADVILQGSYSAYDGPEGHRGVLETSSATSPNYYTYADYDSATERKFAEALESAGDRVRLYIRLPRTFDVPTPVGTFSPDYAIVATRNDSSEIVYLVQEVKSTLLEGERRKIENQRVRFARKHFAAAPQTVEFAVTRGEDGLRFQVDEEDLY